MPYKTDFRERFLMCLPRLLNNSAFTKVVTDSLGRQGAEILDRARNRIALDEEDKNDLSDAALNAYMECAEQILSPGWDGDAPGMSGAIWLEACGGTYIITSSDYDDLGPFSSLEDALEEECFNTVTANPQLRSTILPKERLLEIAGQVVDWENEGTIEINSVTYRVSGDALIVEEEEEF